MTQRTNPQSGMRINNYRLTVKLGQGIFSETWLAEHAYLESKEVCLKVFVNERFRRNLRKQKFLPVVKVPNSLIHLEDYDPGNEPPYIAQELLGGRSLRQLLREHKKLKSETALTLIEKVANILKHLHKKDVAHLDLRPEHIIVSKNGRVCLLDYALGKVTTFTIAEYYRDYVEKNISLPKAIMRSLVYKSKRQRTGFQFDTQADIFALGILLFEMVTGNYPSRKASFPSDLEENLPGKIDNIYAQCCGKADDVYQDLDEFLSSIRGDQTDQIVESVAGIQVLVDEVAVVSVFTLGGDKKYVDGKNISTLSKNLDEILASRLRFIAFDFSDIDYLSSSAIGFLINFSDRIKEAGGAMVMFQVHKKVMTILTALGLEKVVDIIESEKDAEKHLLTLANEKAS